MGTISIYIETDYDIIRLVNKNENVTNNTNNVECRPSIIIYSACGGVCGSKRVWWSGEKES